MTASQQLPLNKEAVDQTILNENVQERTNGKHVRNIPKHSETHASSHCLQQYCIKRNKRNAQYWKSHKQHSQWHVAQCNREGKTTTFALKLRTSVTTFNLR